MPTTVYASAALYVGCTASISLSFTIGLGGSASTASCNAACAQYHYTYAQLGAGGVCYCGDNAPSAGDYSPAGGAQQIGSNGAYSVDCIDYPFYVSDTTYTVNPVYGLCQSSLTVTPVTPGAVTTISQTVAGPEQCFQFCESYTDVYYTISSAGYDCTCFSSSDGTNAVAHTTADGCDSTSIYWFQHEAGAYVTDANSPAQPSAWAKRQARERLARRRAGLVARDALCPGAASACKVPGIVGSYECVDTQTELESCGGCTYGSFTDSSATKGVDCTKLAGVSSGSVTCVSGQCKAYACQAGYTLASDGTCA
ncbi:hypothetical protein Q5752_002995 [Cryptotrichosporon argae]